jgi:hypothetical protein
MPIPLLPLALGALVGAAAGKKDKSDFQVVKGRKKKDGTTGNPYIRRKPKKSSW